MKTLKRYIKKQCNKIWDGLKYQWKINFPHNGECDWPG